MNAIDAIQWYKYQVRLFEKTGRMADDGDDDEWNEMWRWCIIIRWGVCGFACHFKLLFKLVRQLDVCWAWDYHIRTHFHQLEAEHMLSDFAFRDIKFHHVLHVARNVNTEHTSHVSYIKKCSLIPFANVSMEMAGMKIWATVTRQALPHDNMMNTDQVFGSASHIFSIWRV